MSTKTYHLNAKFFASYPIIPVTPEIIERIERENQEKLASMAAELVAAGLSDGCYTNPCYPKLMYNYEFVVTDPRAAALIAEKYSPEVHISKPGGKLFAFDSSSSVPTWLYPEVTPAQRAFSKRLARVTVRLQYLISVSDSPEKAHLLQRLEVNARKTTNIDQLEAVEQRIEYHRTSRPEGSWLTRT